MISQDKKREIAAKISEMYDKSASFYLIDFSGLTAMEAVALRREFRKVNAEMFVAKNTLFNRVLTEKGVTNIPADKFTGPTGIAFAYGDPIAPAKVIRKSFDKDKKPVLKAAIIEGAFFDGAKIKEISELPTREELIAGILGALNAPASGIVGAVNAVMRDLASVIEEVAKKRAA